MVLVPRVILDGADAHRLRQYIIGDALVRVRCHAGALILGGVVEIIEAEMIAPVLGLAHHVFHLFFSQQLNGNRLCHGVPLPVCNSVFRRSAMSCLKRIAFLAQREAGLQNIPKQDASVLRQLDRHLPVCTVVVTLSGPVEPLAVLRAHQRGIDKHGFHAQLRRDLRPDGGRHGFVILVEEVVRLVLIAGDAVIQEQLPADAAGLGLAVLGLCDAPMGAQASADQQFHSVLHLSAAAMTFSAYSRFPVSCPAL